jgi:hypothetical protein
MPSQTPLFASRFPLLPAHFQLSPLTPLDPTLTSKWAAKSFSFNTYKKQGGGGGGADHDPLATDAPRPYSFPVTKPCASSRSIVRVRPYRCVEVKLS